MQEEETEKDDSRLDVINNRFRQELVDMISFFRISFIPISFLIGLFIGLGSTWVYFGVSEKGYVNLRRRQILRNVGIFFMAFGFLFFLGALLLYFNLHGSVTDISFLLFIIVTVLESFIILLPSIFFLKRR